MSTQTISGLHTCKKGNEPKAGDVKTFVIEHKTGKSGKPYIKIKSAGADYGGTPHRIVSASQTDFVDAHGNLSFNLEVEAAGDSAESGPRQAPQSPPQRQNQPQASRPQPEPENALRALMEKLGQVTNAMWLVEKAVSLEHEQAKVSGCPVTDEGFGGKCSSAYREIQPLVQHLPSEPMWSVNAPKERTGEEPF